METEFTLLLRQFAPWFRFFENWEAPLAKWISTFRSLPLPRRSSFPVLKVNRSWLMEHVLAASKVLGCGFMRIRLFPVAWQQAAAPATKLKIVARMVRRRARMALTKVRFIFLTPSQKVFFDLMREKYPGLDNGSKELKLKRR